MSATKNPCAKTVKPENAYEVWQGHGWTWYVCKKYQTPEKEATNRYARWFCYVTSPLCPEGEYGDVYVSEIKGSAHRVAVNPKTGRKIA
jgi:hypothetical protein